MILNPETPRKWIIYTITNPEGRVYVGKTCSGRKRFNSHFNLKRQSNKYLAASIEKYGYENHKVDYVDQFEGTDEYANGKEIFWIRSYMSNINKYPECNGFNQTDGGKSLKGYSHTNETKIKIGAANKNRYVGVKPVAAIKASSERRKRAVLKFDLNGNLLNEFGSTAEAAQELYGKSGSCGHICSVASGKMKSFRGFVYKYKTA